MQDISLDENSMEVATLVAGSISIRLQDRSKCSECKAKLSGSKDDILHDEYFNILDRGGLTVPSAYLNEFVYSSFAILDYAHCHLCECIMSSRFGR